VIQIDQVTTCTRCDLIYLNIQIRIEDLSFRTIFGRSCHARSRLGPCENLSCSERILSPFWSWSPQLWVLRKSRMLLWSPCRVKQSRTMRMQLSKMFELSSLCWQNATPHSRDWRFISSKVSFANKITVCKQIRGFGLSMPDCVCICTGEARSSHDCSLYHPNNWIHRFYKLLQFVCDDCWRTQYKYIQNLNCFKTQA